MSHEPHITGRIFWICCKATLTSSLVFVLSLVAMIFLIPSAPEDDGHIRGAAIALGFVPILAFLLLIYFMILSGKKTRPLKFALVIQSLLLFPLSAFVFYAAFMDGGLFVAVTAFAYMFLYLSVIVGSGAWVWSKR